MTTVLYYYYLLGPQGPTQKIYIDTAYSKVLSKGILVMK